MKQITIILLLVTGFCLWGTAFVVAQDDDGDGDDPAEVEEIEYEYEYAGTRECRDCHRDAATAHADTPHALTFIELEDVDEDEPSPVVADFGVESDLLTVNFPDGERAFNAEDITYTLGMGRHVQAYVTDLDGTLYVLPVEWDTVESDWRALELAESWPDAAYEYGPNCAGCHTVGLDTQTYEWEEAGVSCESCHGPGLPHVEAADDAGGTIDDEERALIYGLINIAIDGQTCGQCHVRGTSADEAHPYPTEYHPLNDVTLSDAYTFPGTEDTDFWWLTGHAAQPNMQYNEWLISGHPNSLEAAQSSDAFDASCLQCHSSTQMLIDLRLGNEDIDPETVDPLALIEEHNYGITCATCHNPHPDEDEDGETILMPSSLRMESYALCTSCHSDNDVTDGVHYPVQQVYEGQPVIDEVTVDPGVHFTAEGGPTCSTCHMPSVPTYNGERSSHSFSIIAPGEVLDVETLTDSCSTCHEGGPAGLQQLIDSIQSNTLERIDSARAASGDETPEWVSIALDTVENDGSAGIHNTQYTNALLTSVETELGLIAEVAVLDDEAIIQQVREAVPPVAPQQVDVVETSVSDPLFLGLTPPSVAILAVCVLILIISAFAFFRSNQS